MAADAKFLAFDLGAESGRAVLGLFDGERVRLEDVHRFTNEPVRILNTLHWDVLRQFAELKRGLGMAVAAHGAEFNGIGIDTWGVDFGLIGKDDALLGNPRHYRDHGNDGMMEAAFETMPRSDLFGATGIQLMQFNSLFQLVGMQRRQSSALEAAQTLLFMPDLFNFWFTGVKATEFSIASTSQMVDPRTRSWSQDVLDRFGLRTGLLTDIVEPGATIGSLRKDIASETGCGPISIIAPAEHDTGSAVVAVPAATPDYAYISSGTWSLMGIETPAPRITEFTARANFTNEGGACGTIRLLKNIMGLWLVQECRRVWARQGHQHPYAELAEMAGEASPFASLIEPDDTAFLAPADMPAAIAAFCLGTGQRAPETPGAVVRCCLESLALKYRWTLQRLEELHGKRIEVIHIVGGGTRNRLLCQLAADATDRVVIAGPAEATAVGNVLMQALGCGMIGSLADARAIVRLSFPLDTYEPSADRAEWEDVFARFLRIKERAESSDVL